MLQIIKVSWQAPNIAVQSRKAFVIDTQLYLSFKLNSDVGQHNIITAKELCVKAIRNWMLDEEKS